MITTKNLEEMIKAIGFASSAVKRYVKYYKAFACSLSVDFAMEKIIYPEDRGMKITHHTTCNFSKPENFVVLECVDKLLEKGYRPEHIELEKEWTLGHDAKGGRADICVYDEGGKTLFIVECKTSGSEYLKEYKNICFDGGQLFSYWQQEGSCKWLSIYASDFVNGEVITETESIECTDDANILAYAKKDASIRLYRDAHTVEELYAVWDETYEKRFCGDVIFRDDSQAYNIGVKPLRKADLKDFSENDKVVNRFEEILRHNNVSDKENAFNRLIALFICKLVDEIQKSDNEIVEFQYKAGDTYESLQDRLQRLHKEGMEKFMREEIFYVPDNYAEKLVQQYTGHKRQKMIDELRGTLRILKFYTNNDFAFTNVHNEELFYQNGKILVEVVQLFQEYRIIGSADVQMLGDLFEQLLNKGFKQNEGQFFTPIPIARFIWDSLPLEWMIRKTDGLEYPKIVDYACGAGHFLTEGFEAVNACVKKVNAETEISRSWAERGIYGIEKDYRLARVSKISLFMHGAGDGNIVFGDGLENYPDKSIIPGSFDILVANPPYSVKAFKPHLKLKNNSLNILGKISNDGSEIETLFVERISQLVRPFGVAAVILPSSILNKENESFTGAREILLKNFFIRAIAQFGSKTFGATGTNTVILFLQKFDDHPKRTDLIDDSVNAIYDNIDLDEWEDSAILRDYLKKIGVARETYYDFVTRAKQYTDWADEEYFGQYYAAFIASTEYIIKRKQKGFIKSSKAEKEKWYNRHFYDFASKIEKEKLLYFALIYRQTTLVITAPDDNKRQEAFLGYKWSNRKGQEGIQIIKAGGLLYNDTDRFDDMTLSGVIRNSFRENVYDVPKIEEYFYHLRLQDMLDFSSVTFNKAIKTTRTRELKNISGLTNYRLSDKSVFEVCIGNRVLSTEIIEEGDIPVYSANVFEKFGYIGKQNLNDFSLPSILWGIDGDWMVNMIPANQPFYPTDHCGVLRVHSDKILPKYLSLALETEGKLERFSRHNRASIQRIQALTIQVPEMPVQEKIVSEISAIENQIIAENEMLKQLFEDARNRFVLFFGSPELNPFAWDVSTLRAIALGDLAYGSGEASCLYDGKIRYVRITDIDDFGCLNDDMVSANIEEDKYILNSGDILFARSGATVGKTYWYKEADGKCLYAGYLIRLVPNTEVVLPEYLFYFTKTDYYKQFIANASSGMAQPNINAQQYGDLQLPIPPIELQIQFADFIKENDNKRAAAYSRRNNLLNQKSELMKRYFV